MGGTGQQGDLAESEGRCLSPSGAGWASAAAAMRRGQEAGSVRFVPAQRGRLAGPLRRALKASRFWRQSTAPETPRLSIYTPSFSCIFLSEVCF